MPSSRGRRAATSSARTYRLGGKANAGTLSWGDVNVETVTRTIEAVTDNGDAILFGRTSDGGALSVRVLSGGQTFAEYFPSVELAEQGLTIVQEDVKG